VRASLIDCSNAVAFVAADDVLSQFGVAATASPARLDAASCDNSGSLLTAVDDLRRVAGVAMGIGDATTANIPLGSPKVAFVHRPVDFVTTDGQLVGASEYDIGVRFVSMERFHHAVPGTVAMCLAAAAAIDTSVVHDIVAGLPSFRHLMSRTDEPRPLRIASPAGVIEVRARVQSKRRGDHSTDDHGDHDVNMLMTWHVDFVSIVRTQRRLMDGFVYGLVDE
jgi:2-methylaconitate cis-trans-isomerase PrpF